jgi:hypothetical protein|tara:strand:- start:174 stop:455 length:282 start_codon:yes stop_codon:yes gene_type:complete
MSNPKADVITFEDPVNHPKHYNINWKGEKAVETYDYINSWRMNYAQGNIIKYVSRYPYKGKSVEDLKKARWYLDKLIGEEEAKRASQEKPREV